jgi:AraC-like DNA-binding protein
VRAVALEELPLSAADQSVVARRLGVSSATLRRKLEQRHGARYVDLVTDLRRDRAASALADTELSIDEVAIQAGFAQKTAFYRAFRRWFGCTPAEYRRARTAPR